MEGGFCDGAVVLFLDFREKNLAARVFVKFYNG